MRASRITALPPGSTGGCVAPRPWSRPFRTASARPSTTKSLMPSLKTRSDRSPPSSRSTLVRSRTRAGCVHPRSPPPSDRVDRVRRADVPVLRPPASPVGVPSVQDRCSGRSAAAARRSWRSRDRDSRPRPGREDPPAGLPWMQTSQYRSVEDPVSMSSNSGSCCVRRAFSSTSSR